jgi:predicted SprT family Zn-dependent metalloprotease
MMEKWIKGPPNTWHRVKSHNSMLSNLNMNNIICFCGRRFVTTNEFHDEYQNDGVVCRKCEEVS